MMKTVIETVGPDLARKYLLRNKDNRPMRQRWVDRLAKMIESGDWMLTHQGIAFDKDGNLIDGQHRLMAIIQAGKAVTIQVSRNVEPEAYRHVDGGERRTPDDRLKLVSDARVNVVAAALVSAYIRHGPPGVRGLTTIDETENAFLGMADAFEFVATSFTKKLTGITRSDVGAAIVTYVNKHPKEGKQFTTLLLSGEGLTKSSPVLTLREALVLGRLKPGSSEAYWKTISATRAHYESRQISALNAATIDWNGNRFDRLFHQYSARNKKIAETSAAKRKRSA